MSDKRRYYWFIAGIGLLILLMAIFQFQPSESVDQASPVPPTAGLPAPTMIATALLTESCERPYADSSIWNTPIDWSIAKIHPMSDLMMQAFFEAYNWIGTDTTQYTPNVYWVSNATPLVPVRLREYRFRDALSDVEVEYGEPGGIVWMPLPGEARPAEGTDGQLVVINMDTGEEWGLNKGSVDELGNWYAGGVYRYSVLNSGLPPEGFAQRGAGIGQLAGIVRRCEVDRGRINHAVTIAYDYPCAPEVCQQNGWPAFVPPFRKTDGRGNSQYDLPEGARLAIRPEVTPEDIETACASKKGCIVWVQNMQEYGGFVVDNSDHPKTYAEGHPTAAWNPSDWTKDMLRDIPTDWFVVIDWNYPSTKVP